MLMSQDLQIHYQMSKEHCRCDQIKELDLEYFPGVPT